MLGGILNRYVARLNLLSIFGCDYLSKTGMMSKDFHPKKPLRHRKSKTFRVNCPLEQPPSYRIFKWITLDRIPIAMLICNIGANLIYGPSPALANLI